MEAMRFVENPQKGYITINLPEELRSQKMVEIIVLPYEHKSIKKKNFDPTKFRGLGKLNMSIDEIDNECKRLRDEWNRNF